MTWLPQVPFGHLGLLKIGPLRGLWAQVQVRPRLEDGGIRLRPRHPKQPPIGDAMHRDMSNSQSPAMPGRRRFSTEPVCEKCWLAVFGGR